jgi:hypothetical protein
MGTVASMTTADHPGSNRSASLPARAALPLAAALLGLFAALGGACGGSGEDTPSGSSSRGAGGAGGDSAASTSSATSSSGGGSSTSTSTGSGGSPCDVTAPEARFVAPSGDDGAAGTELAPFATLQHALDVAIPGTTIFVRTGVYAELVSFPSSGEPGAPITLRAYCGEAPVLDGSGLGGDQSEPALVSIVDQSHVVVLGLELRGLQGQNGNFPAGIWVRGAIRDVLLQENEVHDITAEGGGQDAGAHGIAIYGTTKVPSEDVRVVGNTLHSLVLGPSEALVVNGNVRNFEVTDNTVHDVNNIAFDFIGFESDVCPSCSQADVDTDDVNRARHGLVRGNTAHHMTTAQNPAYGGEKAAACFYVDGGASITLEQNLAHHCDLGVELASEHYQRATRDIVVRSNFFYANDVTGIALGGYDPGNGPGGGSAEDNLIVGNTFVDCSRSGWADTAILLQNRNIQNTIVNNVIVATDGHSTVADGGSANTGNVFDYNVYWNGALDGVNGGSHSIEADPQLVDAANGDLHLTATSPGVGAGSLLDPAVIGALDFDGEPRVQGALDIGADER